MGVGACWFTSTETRLTNVPSELSFSFVEPEAVWNGMLELD